MSNVIDMEQWVQGKADQQKAHEAWEHELSVATAHSVGHLYIDKLRELYPHASESLLVYKVMCGLTGRALEMLDNGDPAAPALFGWMQYIAQDVADKAGFDLNDEDLMDEGMAVMYAHRFGEPAATQEDDS